MTRQSIREHEGNKYIRTIYPCLNVPGCSYDPIVVDIYSVIKAFDVTCPATQHAIKKLLCAGLRDKGSRLADLKGAMAALNRAIDMEEQQGEKRKVESSGDDGKGKWEVVSAKDQAQVIGYQVRWSIPNQSGEYLYVRHYLTDPDEEGGPSLTWCHHAAERDANELNKKQKFPFEFLGGDGTPMSNPIDSEESTRP